MKEREETVTVVPLSGIGRALAYRIPPGMESRLEEGSLVRIPLSNRVERGIVVAKGDDGSFERSRMKELYGLEQPFAVMRADGIRLARWMASYYSCGLEQVMEVMIPRAVRRGMGPKRKWSLRLAEREEEAALEKLERGAPQQYAVMVFLKGQEARRTWPAALLMKRLKVSRTVLSGLVKKGFRGETQERSERVA